jgi:hypothetical protein
VFFLVKKTLPLDLSYDFILELCKHSDIYDFACKITRPLDFNLYFYIKAMFTFPYIILLNNI